VHEAPYWSHGRARRMARTAGITAVSLTVCLAAGLAAGIATGQRGSYNPALPRGEQPGGGALFVGGGVAMLVGLLLKIAYVVYERRRDPDKRYSVRPKLGRARTGMTAPEYIRLLAVYSLLPVLLCCFGIWQRLAYG